MEILFAAGMMSIAREGDDHRFEGTTMLSALPGAPVIPERRRAIARVRRAAAKLRAGKHVRTLSA